MTYKIYRFLIIFSFAAVAIALTLSIVLRETPPLELQKYLMSSCPLEYQDCLERQSSYLVVNPTAGDIIIALIICFVFITTFAVIAYGLFYYKTHSRELALILTFSIVAAYPIIGYLDDGLFPALIVKTGWEEMCWMISAMAWGGVLATSFSSPVEENFVANTKMLQANKKRD